MFKIGCHLSSARGFLAMGQDALKVNANTFQFFTRNPRGSKARDIDPEDARALRKLAQERQFAVIIAHSPYTLNPCSPDPKVRAFAELVMADDMLRMECIPGNCYNFHPGSHVGQGEEAAIEMIATLLNTILKPGQSTTVLLETMAGKGSEVGRTFEEIRQILDRVGLQEKMGVCFDTCHVYDAGYDIANDLDGVLDHFDAVIGLHRLCAVHLNDSKNPLGSRKDRHACIGEGTLGLDAMERIINNPRLRDLPFILETPNDLDGYAREIKLLRDMSAQ